MATEGKERKSETLLINPGNVEMGFVVSGMEYKLKFQKISDGGSVNTPTFSIERFEHTFTINGVELSKVFDTMFGQLRIQFASNLRRGTAAEAKAMNGGSTELKAMFEKQPKAARAPIDPVVGALEKFASGTMTPDEMDEAIRQLQAKANEAKAKQAGVVV